MMCSKPLDTLLCCRGRWQFDGGVASSFPTVAGPVLTVRHRRFTMVARRQRGVTEAVHFDGSWACANRVISGLADAVSAA